MAQSAPDEKSLKTNWVVFYEDEDWDIVKKKSNQIIDNVYTKQKRDKKLQYVYLGIKQNAELNEKNPNEIKHSWYFVVRFFIKCFNCCFISII